LQEARLQVEIYVVGVVAQTVDTALLQTRVGEAREGRAAKAARGGQDRVLLLDIASEREIRLHGSRQHGRSGDPRQGRRRGSHLDRIEGTRLEDEIA
jgi:hypothetical protein